MLYTSYPLDPLVISPTLGSSSGSTTIARIPKVLREHIGGCAKRKKPCGRSKRSPLLWKFLVRSMW